MDNELYKATDQVYNHLTRGIKRSYIYIEYLNCKNEELNDIIVGIQEDYKSIKEYVDHARKLIANINSVDIDCIIIEDYKLFGPFLKRYIHIHYRIDKLKLIRDDTICLETDYFDIDGYLEDAKSVIASKFNVNKEEVIITDYKYFGTELYSIDI